MKLGFLPCFLYNRADADPIRAGKIGEEVQKNEMED